MEFVYQYLWKHRLFGRRLPLVGEGAVEILHPGILNTDAGPDFFNARLRFGATDIAGNVEIHVKASDRYRHAHDRDHAYDSVALHVVGEADRQVTSCDDRLIPTVEVTIPENFVITYAALAADRKGIRCQTRLKELSRLEISDWVETLAMERLQMKASRIAGYLKEFNGDWNRAFFVTLARGLGFGLNSLPFEMMAKSIPLNYLGRHSDHLQQIEALLFGQAGMLDPNLFKEDRYYHTLCREYSFLSGKYSLTPIGREVWKYARTRPQNFPHRRIAMLARICHSGEGLFDCILDNFRDFDILTNLFNWRLEGYWQSHSSFGSPENSGLSTTLSRQSVYLLMINVVAPILYAYGTLHDDEAMTYSATDLLEFLPAEKNSLMVQWNSGGLRPEDAMRSQALIHLRKEYCDPGRCLECRFGYHLLKRQMRPD